MNNFIDFNALTDGQMTQYREAITHAFPAIIGESPVIKNCWSKLESYFPSSQLFLMSDQGEVIGFMNTVPFRFEESLDHLPDRGWDWMLMKSIQDFELETTPNYLGGLQVIVRQKFQGQGYSKVILSHAKNYVADSHMNNLIIPIRPTKKHEFPSMTMSSYLTYKPKDKLYDPWIRTHIASGAHVIKVCEQSMIMKGNVHFWESILNQKIERSGQYQLDGALSLIKIDVENDTGEYIEPNIWIKY